MIKVIAFDLDNTLWEVDPVIVRAEKKMIEWFRREVPQFSYEQAPMRQLRGELLSQKPELGFRLTEFRRQLMHRAMVNHGIADHQAKEHAASAMDVFLEARNQVEFYEGVLDALGHLRQAYQLGALTNGNADIHRLGLSDFFSFAFSAEQVGAPKPAPDLFLRAMEHAECDPHEMVYVGDDPVKDVEAAAALGLKTVWFKRPDAERDCTPDQVIEHLSQLPNAIEQLL